jgi:hypothetical protein
MSSKLNEYKDMEKFLNYPNIFRKNKYIFRKNNWEQVFFLWNFSTTFVAF